jgi:NADH dehydrogenase [ubiquinone] 1 alpha subcomplex assembly factor 5
VTTIPQIFDRTLARRRRARAARRFADFDFLAARAASELAERLDDLGLRFATAVYCGAPSPFAAPVERLISLDTTPEMPHGGAVVIGDEERLPFAPASFELYVSVLTLHGLNDVPGALAQIRRALKPDGVFMAAMFGGETLKELRQAFAAAEIECDGGLSPRVFPFADLRDMGGLLQRAGFAEPIADVDSVTVHYDHPLKLLHDLRGMGETNVVVERRRTPLKRRTLERMCEIYVEQFGESDGRVPATFQILHLTGRARFEAQQQPLDSGKRMRLD